MTSMALSSSLELKIIGFHVPSQMAPTGLVIGASSLSLRLLLSLPCLPLWFPCPEKQDQQPASHGCRTPSRLPRLRPLTTCWSFASCIFHGLALCSLPLPLVCFCGERHLPDYGSCFPKSTSALSLSFLCSIHPTILRIVFPKKRSDWIPPIPKNPRWPREVWNSLCNTILSLRSSFKIVYAIDYPSIHIDYKVMMKMCARQQGPKVNKAKMKMCVVLEQLVL